MKEKRRQLTVADRALIELRLLDGMGVRAIATPRRLEAFPCNCSNLHKGEERRSHFVSLR